MNKTTEALKLALDALNAMLTHMGMDEDEWTKPTFNQAREALAAIREALAEPVQEHESREDIAAKEMFEGFSKAWAEPVKQEPVYAFRRRGLDDFYTCTKERYEELADMPNLFEVTTFYAAPVRTKDLTYEEVVEIIKDLPFNNSRVMDACLLYTSPSPRDGLLSRMPSSA